MRTSITPKDHSYKMTNNMTIVYPFAEALLSLGVAPAAPVQMQTVVEEECTGNGALVIADQLKADAVIIPEPFNQMICTGQLGVLWMRVSVQGKPAHVLDTSAGINALDAAYYLVSSLKSLEEKWNLPEYRPELWKDFKHPINFNFGTIKGGEWPSSVPAFAEFELRIGFFPNQSISDVKKDVEAALEEAAKAKNLKHSVTYNGFQAEGASFPTPESDFFQALASVHQEVMQQPPKFGALTCTTDARFFQLYHGMPSTCYGPESTSIHGIDESVSLESMNNVARVLALFLARWCKLERV
jgi:acetylornithine deacetylase